MSSINYEDERFTKVEEERKEALTENEQLYGGMIDKSDEFYQGLVDESKNWAEQQSQIQQEQTDFTIEQIEQQKEKAEKDYIKEQKGAYTDLQKQNNQYGVQAEQMAGSGLGNTGFSESSKVSTFNTYQNRVATAKASFDNAVLTYNNAMKEAKLQNSSAQAEIAHNALVQQLQYLLQGFNYKNELLLDEANKKLTINSMYDSKYQAIVDQINTENALAEQKRQFDEQMAEEKRQFDASLKASRSSGGSGGGSYYVDVNNGANNEGVQLSSTEVASDTSYFSAVHKVSTPYYRGALNKDVSIYGAFDSNYLGINYQPKGISGYGKVTSTGQKTTVTSVVKYGNLAGQTVTSTQTIWKTSDGTRWIWNGTANKYEKI